MFPVYSVTYVPGPYPYFASLAPYGLAIQHFSGPTTDLDMTVFSFSNNLEYAVPASSLMDPANAHGAYSVAAVYQVDWTLPNPPAESFSSQGPTNDGRQKPDITAPDGTTSASYGLSSFGTSFSSPTTAGAAALLRDEDLGRTASDLALRLTALAEDIGDPGIDTVFGAGKLYVEVEVTNTPPTAVNDTAITNEDTAVLIDVLANDSDPDEGDLLSVSLVTLGTNGSVTNNGTDVTYTPNADFNGSDSFAYTVSDGNGGTDTATVNVTVNATNDAPVANDDSASTSEDTALNIDVLANDTDVDGDSLTVQSVTQSTNGSVTNNGIDVTYTPNADFNGSDSFAYTVSDGNGGTDTATVNVTVDAANNAPVANDDSASTSEDTALNIDVLANDTDVDGDSLTVQSVTQGTNGSVTNNGIDVTYTPNADFNGSDSFAYTVSDGNGGTDTATVNVTVDAANDAPVANDDSASTSEDTALNIDVLANDTDVDGDSLTVQSVTQGTNGSVTNNGTDVTSYHQKVWK